MLTTPLGMLSVAIDGNAVNYSYRAVPLTNACPNLDGRYVITVPFQPDGKNHRITCCLIPNEPLIKREEEGGEDLELISLYGAQAKLSLGMEWSCDLVNGKTISRYDYVAECLPDGCCYSILPTTQTEVFIFGAAWLNEVNESSALQTWFGADPTLTECKTKS